MAAPTYQTIRQQRSKPAIAIDQDSLITWINPAFTETYGWEEADLLGKSVTHIMPDEMRDAHTIGFSRFVTTEQPTLLGKKLDLPIYCKDRRVLDAQHLIVGEKHDGAWRFAATITLKGD